MARFGGGGSSKDDDLNELRAAILEVFSDAKENVEQNNLDFQANIITDKIRLNKNIKD